MVPLTVSTHDVVSAERCLKASFARVARTAYLRAAIASSIRIENAVALAARFVTCHYPDPAGGYLLDNALVDAHAEYTAAKLEERDDRAIERRFLLALIKRLATLVQVRVYAQLKGGDQTVLWTTLAQPLHEWVRRTQATSLIFDIDPTAQRGQILVAEVIFLAQLLGTNDPTYFAELASHHELAGVTHEQGQIHAR